MNESGWIQFVPPCEPAGGGVNRAAAFRGAALRADRLTATLDRTLTTTARFGFEGGAIVFAAKGASLYRSAGEGEWRVAAPESATFVEAPNEISVRLSRGIHEALIVSWPLGTMPILERWLEGRRSEGRKCLGTHPIHPAHSETFRRLAEAIVAADAVSEHVIAGVVMELAAKLTLADNTHSLAAAPADLPEITRRLVEAVRSDPARPWPLKEAADFVGYSPFHFSRIFKAQVGVGFHEFVDRTRTELAVRLLTTTDDSIDYVASESGFGTAQGLRESVKEYLGLVPSELRSGPEDGG